jgi:acyl transferase domain-containing protein/acyl carrier protein
MAKKSEQIAIIGMSGRFPGARNIDEFWRNLRDGVESISAFSPAELEASGTNPSVFENPAYVPAGSVLEDIDLFDAAFFGFSPREAESLDPQQRIFLETAWHALEDAGYEPESYPGVIGVYAGCSASTYLDHLQSNPDFLALLGYLQVYIGNEKDYLATRVSYKLNLRGPSFNVQTACSTSLLAVAVASDALLSRQCDMALAGGVCIRVPQKAGYYFEPGGIFSPDGHCRVFDERAQGVVFGSGVGVVVLKRLFDALADGDRIDAVIRGWAINNDGSAKASYTAPGLRGQADVITQAYKRAGIKPESITYVEAHGTGTSLGDPIEIAALTQAFRRQTKKRNFCAVGSVKTNVGHLDPAAGVASLIKVAMALRHKQIPASLNCDTPNPRIDFANSPFYVNTGLSEWRTAKGPRRAGISAFGIGGTNVHVVLEEASAGPTTLSTRQHHLLVLSARSHSAVEEAASNLVEHLYRNPGLEPADIAYTCQVGRRAFNHRWALVYQDTNQLLADLMAKDPKQVLMTAEVPRQRPIAFMFSGQGSQYPNMASGLYRSEPIFRGQMDLCADLLKQRIGLDLRDLLFEGGEQHEPSSSQLDQTWLTQPALFAIEYCLAKLWMEWGIRPDAMIGHSVGEYVAACLAGVFSVEDALALIAERGRLMQELPAGGMLAVPLSEAEVEPLLGEELDLAATNESSWCTISGPIMAIAELQSNLSARGLDCRRLHTSHAFHSKMMDPIIGLFAAKVAEVTLRKPNMPWISNVTGDWIKSSDAVDPEYWARHIRQPVRFSQGVRLLLQEPDRILLEVGPGQSLSTFARRHPDRSARHLVLSSLRHPQEPHDDDAFLLKSLARLWLSGATVKWTAVHAQERCHRVHLPGYPFERQRYWTEPPQADQSATSTVLKEPEIADWFYVPSWAYAISPASGNRERKTSCWLIFEDDFGIGRQVAARLLQNGNDVITVQRSQEYSSTDSNTYYVNPHQSQHYAIVLNELRDSKMIPDKILHLWNVGIVDEALSEMELFDDYQDLGFFSLIHLVQALIKLRVNKVIDIGMVSSDQLSVSGIERICPARSALIGACKSISQEYPNILCRSMDIILEEYRSRNSERLAEELIAELSEDCTDAVVAYRGGQRWIQAFEPLRLDQTTDFNSALRQDGVYLITGGLGGIGLALAEHLARAFRARLVLLGRSRFPAKQDWHEWLRTHDAADATSIRTVRLQEMEKLGSEVLVISAEVADVFQMRSAIEQTHAHFGGLDGIIHGAGNISPDAFFAVDQADHALCERQFQSKVRGVVVLEQVLRDQNVDFVVLLSSISSVLAGLGYIAYAAANLFMDAFAHKYSQSSGFPWVSINWDTWDFHQRPGEEPDPANLAMTAEEGVEAFRRIMSSTLLPQIVVSTGDLGARMDQWVNLGSLRNAQASRDKRPAHLHARPALATPYVAPRNSLEEAVAEVWQQVLGVSRVGVTDNFFADLSGSSLLATQLVARLRNRFQMELPLHRLFEGPTVAELAVAIDSRFEGVVST